ncbi:glutaminase kidney isoform, mitochondrial-like isoform X1 [Salvelinus fontinalis]|uniref:glutaminase kidney isoform, mitochondrial-like isoform X1 n=1 Tax=Salvelinus fontinalis TaxID=8038 RepID=UPI0024860B91|nr:glutaminase kidney isoform, mitochondrial-like isoform X1 [Salvelinus fontinalis]
MSPTHPLAACVCCLVPQTAFFFSLQVKSVINLLFAAYTGNVSALRSYRPSRDTADLFLSVCRFALSSMDMEQRDYDSRTALHVAAAEGHAEVVRFLLEACKVNPVPIDRWDKTPMEEVLHFVHHDMVTILQDYQNKYNPQEAPKKDNETAENNLGGLL